MKGVGKEMTKYLNDFQFGVGVSGGAEAVLHSVNRVMREHQADGSFSMLTVDFSNAFNVVDRSALLHEVRRRCHSISLWVDFLYGQAARLYIGDKHIWSATGVQQGDPLGPLLFALVLHPYGRGGEVIDIIRVTGPTLGLELNIKKTEIFWPSCDGRKLREGLFPVDIRRPSLGVKLLGGAVSRDRGFISELAMKRAVNADSYVTHKVSSYCFDLVWALPNFSLVYERARPYTWRRLLCFLTKALQNHILRDSDICGMDDDYGCALACLRDTIPSFDFSGFTIKNTAPSKAQHTLASALFSKMVKDMEVHFDMTVRQKAVFECLRAPHSQDFLLAIPIDGLGQHMSHIYYRSILKYRLMIPLFPVDEICPVCRKACLDTFGEHAVHCKDLPGFKYRHDMKNLKRCIRDTLRKKRMVAFLILDNPKESITEAVEFFEAGKEMHSQKYMDSFPFPFYVILKDIENLPRTLADLLRQWFELMQNSGEDGVSALVKNLLDGSELGSFRQGGGDIQEERTAGNAAIKQCLRKVAYGHFTAAMKVLCSSGVASYSDDTIKALEAKHPYKPPPSMSTEIFSDPPLIAEIDSVLGCVKSFPKGTSCGRDGLRSQHILDARCGEWGMCPLILAKFVASAPLTPLLKPDNGIRPIALGTIWRHLVSKFGVGVSGGAEAVLHSVNRVMREHQADGSFSMLTVDFSNAFNVVDRSALLHEVRRRCHSISLWVDFLYGQAARLYIGDKHIWTATGVQQGDPLGPLLFALVLHPLVHKIKDNCKLLVHAWYLDDGSMIRDVEEVAKLIDIIRVTGPTLGLELNIKKTEIFWPSCDGRKLREGLFPVDIRRPSLGTVHMEEAAMFFDKGLRDSVEDMVVCGGPFYGDFQWAQSWALQNHILRDSDICGMDDDYGCALACLRDTIPSFNFSGFTNKNTAPSKAQHTLASALFSKMVKDMEVHFDMIYRLMIPLFPVDEICPVCRKAFLDTFGEHAVHCKELPGFKYRHDMVRDVLFDICRRAGISAKKEVPVNFLRDPLDGRSTLRPADDAIYFSNLSPANTAFWIMSAICSEEYDSVTSLFWYEGFRGLYRGFGTSLVGTIPARATYMTALEITKSNVGTSIIRLGFPEPTAAAIANAMAGLTAALAAQLVWTPVDVVSQRLMVQGKDYSNPKISSTSEKSSKYMNGIDAFRKILNTDGPRGLYRGFGISIMTYAPSNAVWWASYSVTQRLVWGGIGSYMCNDNGGVVSFIPDSRTVMAVQGVSAAMAGGVSALVTMPLDTIKTRLQVLDSSDDNNGRKVPTIGQTVRNLVREGGWMAFYRGLGPRWASMSMSATTMITTYELLKRLSTKNQENLIR
ncbi:hypothetical protein LXL04_008246 [Taraxacum kok-saghyz]